MAPALAEFEPLEREPTAAIAERERLGQVLEENRRLQMHNLELEQVIASLVREGHQDAVQHALHEKEIARSEPADKPQGFVASAAGSELKFQATQLKLGMPSEATEGLMAALGLDYQTLSELLAKGSEGIKEEFYNTGRDTDKANYEYVKGCAAQDKACMPEHVKQAIADGKYHGGPLGPDDFDFGHGGMKLQDFLDHTDSKTAGLEEPEVLALRLYTTDSYTMYNNPLRQHQRPHPLRITVWYLAQGLRKLRSVDAIQHPLDFRRVKYFWRGMRNMALNMTAFERRGGTELAPMSTTDAREVAFTYANSTEPLIMNFRASGMSRGCDISYLSVFPKEKEYLYPPLTYLEPAGTDEVDGYDVVVIRPQI